MKLSEYGARFIAGFEGFRACPYGPPRDVWTIGYGSTRGVTGRTPCVTRSQALARMRREVDETYGASVNRAILRYHLHLNQNQFDALTSAVYNLGPGVLEPGRSLGKALANGGRVSAVAGALMQYVMPGSIFEAGLRRRRRAEAKLYATAATDPRLAKWRQELDRRRKQLAVETSAGARHFLRRRIHDLVAAISKNR